ncbi:hypothetical protein HDK90DRAFT_46542 [Phyllosticta capitalensis]|uniref:Uncharacterized protein n=1 Tax=Phyllosticta capitalensis TaxID=121624 RepID=A0ABR1Z5V4_9PEZI
MPRWHHGSGKIINVEPGTGRRPGNRVVNARRQQTTPCCRRPCSRLCSLETVDFATSRNEIVAKQWWKTVGAVIDVRETGILRRTDLHLGVNSNSLNVVGGPCQHKSRFTSHVPSPGCTTWYVRVEAGKSGVSSFCAVVISRCQHRSSALPHEHDLRVQDHVKWCRKLVGNLTIASRTTCPTQGKINTIRQAMRSTTIRSRLTPISRHRGSIRPLSRG